MQILLDAPARKLGFKSLALDHLTRARLIRTLGTIEMWPNGKARGLGPWDCWFKSSHLDFLGKAASVRRADVQTLRRQLKRRGSFAAKVLRKHSTLPVCEPEFNSQWPLKSCR